VKILCRKMSPGHAAMYVAWTSSNLLRCTPVPPWYTAQYYGRHSCCCKIKGWPLIRHLYKQLR